MSARLRPKMERGAREVLGAAAALAMLHGCAQAACGEGTRRIMGVCARPCPAGWCADGAALERRDGTAEEGGEVLNATDVAAGEGMDGTAGGDTATGDVDVTDAATG